MTLAEFVSLQIIFYPELQELPVCAVAAACVPLYTAYNQGRKQLELDLNLFVGEGGTCVA